LARERLYRSRMQYKNTYEEFHKIKDRFWTRYTHREILVDALQRQQKAMERYERQNLNQKDMLKARKAVLNKITKRQKKEMDRARGKKSRDNVIQKIKDFGKWDRGR